MGEATLRAISQQNGDLQRVDVADFFVLYVFVYGLRGRREHAQQARVGLYRRHWGHDSSQLSLYALQGLSDCKVADQETLAQVAIKQG